MTVEKATIDDISELTQLRLAYLLEDFGHLADHEADAIRKELPDYFRRTLGRELTAFVIRDGETIVSCAFLLVVIKPMSPAFLNGKTGTVLNVYTRPAFRRMGYAGKIMETLLNEAKEMQLSLVELKSTDAGHTLYQSVGFADDPSRYHPMKWVNPFR